jgi:hypothetical protein
MSQIITQVNQRQLQFSIAAAQTRVRALCSCLKDRRKAGEVEHSTVRTFEKLACVMRRTRMISQLAIYGPPKNKPNCILAYRRRANLYLYVSDTTSDNGVRLR